MTINPFQAVETEPTRSAVSSIGQLRSDVMIQFLPEPSPFARASLSTIGLYWALVWSDDTGKGAS